MKNRALLQIKSLILKDLGNAIPVTITVGIAGTVLLHLILFPFRAVAPVYYIGLVSAAVAAQGLACETDSGRREYLAVLPTNRMALVGAKFLVWASATGGLLMLSFALGKSHLDARLLEASSVFLPHLRPVVHRALTTANQYHFLQSSQMVALAVAVCSFGAVATAAALASLFKLAPVQWWQLWAAFPAPPIIIFIAFARLGTRHSLALPIAALWVLPLALTIIGLWLLTTILYRRLS